MIKYLTAIFILSTLATQAQISKDSSLIVNEKVQPFIDQTTFYNWVKKDHPIAKQARLIMTQGEMEIRQAKGAFDPKLKSEYETKSFQDKEYYELWDTYVQIPTIFNVDFKAGYQQSDGYYLNPQSTLPEDGLYYAGVSVPLGRGMIHNQRNIDVQKAKISNERLKFDALAVYNNLLLDANAAYWGWYETYQKREMVKQNLSLINEYFEGVRQSVINGDKASLDSVEYKIQLQSWQNQFMKADMDYQNAMIQLENFLWNQQIDSTQQQPVKDLDPSLFVLTDHLDYAVTHNPDLQQIILQNETYKIDQKLKKEMLKPTLDLNFNYLFADGSSSYPNQEIGSNYKGGFEFEFPLLIRKDRAKLQQVKLKIEQTDLKIDQKSRQLLNKIIQTYNKAMVTQALIEQQEDMIANYTLLLEGEQSKFLNGESSVFLVNSRQNKKINAEIKLIDLHVQLGQVVGLLQWFSGSLGADLLIEN